MPERSAAATDEDEAWDVVWKLLREVAVGLGWGGAILLQFAHPLVALHAAEHRRFRARSAGWTAERGDGWPAPGPEHGVGLLERPAAEKPPLVSS